MPETESVTTSTLHSGNLVIGCGASDGGFSNVISLGKSTVATNDDQLVIGVPSQEGVPSVVKDYLRVVVGGVKYKIPLYDADSD